MHHRQVERARAAALTEEVLTRLVECQDEWPLRLVSEVYMYGSFARGAQQPHDVDLDVEFDQSDERWISTVIRSLTNGRDPGVEFRKLLVGRKRGVEFAFNNREEADYDMTLLWQRGEDLDTGLARMRAIKPAPSAGRAQRDAMLPEFEGLDRWLPRPYRETLSAAIACEAITLERLVLPDSEIEHPLALDHLRRRWSRASPLYRAGAAVFAYLIQRGIDPAQVHLHGRDVGTPKHHISLASRCATCARCRSASPNMTARSGSRSYTQLPAALSTPCGFGPPATEAPAG